jgi:uncharacterized protein (TIGR02145 family)
MKLYLILAIQVLIASFHSQEKSNSNQHLPYKTIIIGGKVWMAENYRGNISAGSCYENNLANCMNFGRLFSYEEAIKSAPQGWHLPSKSEWSSLLNAIRNEGKNPYDILTEGSFDAKFAGYKDSYGDYTKINFQTRFWSSTEWENENKNAWYMYLAKSRQMADVDTDEKKCLFSVRYVKD